MRIITTSITEDFMNFVYGKNSRECVNSNPEAVFLIKQAELERLAREESAGLTKTQKNKVSKIVKAVTFFFEKILKKLSK